jgi:methanogenic corrinoid protein MtbC1
MTDAADTAVEGRLASLCRRYLQAQLDGDRREAVRLVLQEGLAAGCPVGELQAGVIQAAQREIGRLWQANRISIAQEHMATAISQVALSRLFEEARPAEPLGTRVLVACVEGELHEFPSRLVADSLELAGHEVRYLGANVPTDDLLKMLRDETPDLLALSVTMSFNTPGLRTAVERVREAFPGLAILAGGHALAWEPGLAARFGVETCAGDGAALCEAVRRLAPPKARR